MLGETVSALTRIDAAGGKVFAEGEYWNAVSETLIEPGQWAQIIGRDGLTLKVKPGRETGQESAARQAGH
jgi:membrane-bound ClpP family serine protease